MNGMNILKSGFMNTEHFPAPVGILPASVSLMQRYEAVDTMIPADLKTAMGQLERGEFTGDPNALMAQFSLTMQNLTRGVTSAMTAFPVRENLEAEATVLLPTETPLRNRIPRVPGSGTAVSWKQITSFGGGWGSSLDQGGGGTAAQIFYGESGAPAELTTVYANKSVAYKLLGERGSVTGFAMATGANFQNQYQTEKTNRLRNVMLNEENALTNGDAASTAAPWGDTVTAFAFNGLVNLITTANGTPAAQVQTSVGALTFAHIDAQLRRLWNQGAQGIYMVMNAQEQLSLKNLAQATGSIHRLVMASPTSQAAGYAITGYVHPITGEVVPVLPSRFLAAGTILYCSDRGPDGRNALEVEVLPQVQLPTLAPNQNVQGYVAQEIAPAWATPQVYGFLISVFETLKMRNALVFAKSTGVTAVS